MGLERGAQRSPRFSKSFVAEKPVEFRYDVRRTTALFLRLTTTLLGLRFGASFTSSPEEMDASTIRDTANCSCDRDDHSYHDHVRLVAWQPELSTFFP